MANLTDVLIAYDVTDDARRARLAALLSRVGLRAQDSVFRCQVRSDEMHALTSQLQQLVDEAEDRLMIVQLCANCVCGVVHVGERPTSLEQAMWVI